MCENLDEDIREFIAERQCLVTVWGLYQFCGKRSEENEKNVWKENQLRTWKILRKFFFGDVALSP